VLVDVKGFIVPETRLPGLRSPNFMHLKRTHSKVGDRQFSSTHPLSGVPRDIGIWGAHDKPSFS